MQLAAPVMIRTSGMEMTDKHIMPDDQVTVLAVRRVKMILGECHKRSRRPEANITVPEDEFDAWIRPFN